MTRHYERESFIIHHFIRGDFMTLTANQVSEMVCAVRHRPIFAYDLLARIIDLETGEQLDGEKLLNLAPDLERALPQVKDLSESAERITRQCLELKPVPFSHQVPMGF